jgi:hypothetical protein
VRELVDFRHWGALEQDWNHGDIGRLERFSDLSPNPILGIVNAPTAFLIVRRQPVAADED